MNIIDKLTQLGYQTIDESWYACVADWDSWYKGSAEKFHNYRVWNGQRHIRCTRYSLGMAKKVCEDWANLLMNEKVKITLEGEKEQAFIDDVFTRNNFEVNMNELQERGAALGTYAVIPRVQGLSANKRGGVVPNSSAEIVMDYVTADRIFPLSWNGREIIECAFTTSIAAKNGRYVYLQIHRRESGSYVIESRVFKTDKEGGTLTDVVLSDVPGFENVPERIFTGSEKPQFVIGRYNIANNIVKDNPMGIAVFANAVDNLKAVDIVYDAYVNEYVLGKKRIMASPGATRFDGEPTFDPNDVVFYTLPEEMKDETFIHEIDMALRSTDLSAGTQDMVNFLAFKCGFGNQHYRFDQGNVSTATQIISENSEMFRTIKKHEIVLESVLIELCRILLRMGNTYMSMKLNEDVEISVDFDDSIIEDKNADFERDMRLLSAGIMGDVEFRMKWMNEDEKTARAALPGMEDLTVGETQDEIE